MERIKCKTDRVKEFISNGKWKEALSIADVLKVAKNYEKTRYGEYLKSVAKEEFFSIDD